MLRDEFKSIPSKVLTIGRSPEESVIAIPKAIFELPPEEKAQALKALEEEMEHHQQKGKPIYGLI
ncbi:hypothetical protein [Streptococcus sp. S784/96/1]|uniref:hypothetical protein n=1 Tax=Streptococcus sp. S784/96/1 TaxID=2653499 RepID=UPI001389E518|nr:hypothetical protein [Streptococcus sp. S784/96/1]